MFGEKPITVKIKPDSDGIRYGIIIFFVTSILRFCGDIKFPGNFEFSGKLRKLTEELIALSEILGRVLILYGDGEKSKRKVKICPYSGLEESMVEIRKGLPGFV